VDSKHILVLKDHVDFHSESAHQADVQLKQLARLHDESSGSNMSYVRQIWEKLEKACAPASKV